MAWFNEKAMSFRYKFCDFDLYIKILTILKFQNSRMSFTMTHATIEPTYLVWLSYAYSTLLHLYNSLQFWAFELFPASRQPDVHAYLVSSVTNLGAGELRHLTRMSLLYFTSHTFCSIVGRLCHLIMWLCYYETSFVIFLYLMICGSRVGLPCKQIMSKHYCFKKLEITRFQSFL